MTVNFYLLLLCIQLATNPQPYVCAHRAPTHTHTQTDRQTEFDLNLAVFNLEYAQMQKR